MNAIRIRKPAVTFYQSGRIHISGWAAGILGLKAGDSINIWEEGGEYYLYAIHNPVGPTKAVVHLVNRSAKNNYYCICSELVKWVNHKTGKHLSKVTAGDVRDIAEIGKGITLILRDIC